MSTIPKPPYDIDSYDSEILLGLGLITTEFSRLEDTLKQMLAMFISPHQFVGRMVMANTNIQVSTESLKVIADERLEPGALKAAVQTWIKEADRLRTSRNQFVHSRWVVHAGTVKDQVKKGKFKPIANHVRPIELFSLAEEMWEVHQEGSHLIMDLARAGFSSITYVDALHITKQAYASEYRLKDIALDGRPPIKGRWPGKKYLPVKK